MNPPTDRPRIQSIGDSNPCIVFTAGKELLISIRGQHLPNRASDYSVYAQTSVPLIPGLDYYLVTNNLGATTSLLLLRFTSHATTNFSSKDRLSININISAKLINDGSLQNAHDMADFKRLVFDPKFTFEQMTSNLVGNIDTNTAWILGYRAVLANLSAAQIAALTNRFNINNRAPGASQKATQSGTENDRVDFKTNWYLTQALMAGVSEAEAFKNSGNIAFCQAPEATLLASMSQDFVLYTQQDYLSQVLAGQVEPQNITAYPLDFIQAEKMFGGFVARHFYPVRLTIQNPTDQDQFISLQKIILYGCALVSADTNNSGPTITIPIIMAPQSNQQIYTVGSDDDSSRDWVFSSLDFDGALATAYQTRFSADRDYTNARFLAKAALGKLWEDKRFFYLITINNFAMPDVVEVPKGGGCLDGKYIFFSKDWLLGVLQYSPSIRKAFDIDRLAGGDSPRKLEKYFSSMPISLTFDSLQVGYANSFMQSQ